MASLNKNKWYGWYKLDAAKDLKLPPYALDEDGCVIVFYGERFCRVPDCSNNTHEYTATNNLHSHIKLHEGVKLKKENKGGRVAQKEVDKAPAWYKGLFQGVEPTASTSSASVESTLPDADLPYLPRKSDGSVHITNMRREVQRLGHKVPCLSCKDRNACCKDINTCDWFILFNCGDLHPKQRDKTPARQPEDEYSSDEA